MRSAYRVLLEHFGRRCDLAGLLGLHLRRDLASLEQLSDHAGRAGDAGQLRGHEDLRRVAVGHGLQALDVAHGDVLLGIVGVQLGEHVFHGLRLAFASQDALGLFRVGDLADGLRLALGFENRGALDALGLLDGRLALAFGLEDDGALLALGLHLAVHRLGHIRRRLDALQLDAHDLDAPLLGGLVEDIAQLRVDGLAAGERLVQGQLADDVTQVGLRELGGSQVEVGDVVDELHGVGCAIVDDGVDRDGHIVLRDDRLRREIRDGLLQRHLARDPLDEGDLDVQTCLPGAAVGSEELDDIRVRLRDDDDAAEQDDKQDDGNDDQYDAEKNVSHQDALLLNNA